MQDKEPSSPLGYNSAVGALEAGRAAFVGSAYADLPTRRAPQIASDDLVPQFGFVGDRYSASRVLLLGINPGNGDNQKRNAADDIQMPPLADFARTRTVEAFKAAQNAYRQVCQAWPMWRRHCSEVIGAGLLTLDDNAYSTCLPWRTASEASFDGNVSRQAAVLYAYPLIDELKPMVVIAMGKKSATILSLGGRRIANLVTWNRAQAATAAAIADRASTAKRIFEILAGDRTTYQDD